MYPSLFNIVATTTSPTPVPTYEQLLADLGTGGPRVNPWQGTCFEHYYLYPNGRRGKIGEDIVTKILASMYNIILTKRTDAAHDRNTILFETIVGANRICPVEIKFALATNKKRNVFMFNHIALTKNFERLILLGVNLGDVTPQHLYWMSREDIQRGIDLQLLSRQQGGSRGNNDDYLLTTSTKKFGRLHSEKLLRSFNEWA